MCVYNDPMNERLRRYYLTALGIDPWCARWPLPGGAPSPASPAEPPEPVESAKPEVIVRGEPGVGQSAGIRGQPASLDAVRDALDAREPRETDEPTEGPENEPRVVPAPGTGHSLHAIVWHDDRFSLMASMPEGLPSERPGRLGCNILRALGASGEAGATMVRWPPFENPELPGNNGDAFQLVLDRLVAGAVSGRWIILGADLHGVVRERLASAEHQILLVAEQTLGELLAEPAAKRALWDQLQPLSHRGGSD